MANWKTIDGVEIRNVSMRLVFRFQGKQRRETLRMDHDKTAMKPTTANILFAKRRVAEINKAIRKGEFSYAKYFPHSKHAEQSNPQSFGDFMEIWFSQLAIKRSTRKCYERYKNNFWKPALGALPLGSIKHSDITTTLNKGNWRSGKTRNNVLAICRSVFDLAVIDGLIQKNPCEAIEQAKWQKRKPDPFELNEAEAIIEYMHAHYSEQVCNFFEFQFFSGLRTSEAIGLTWDAIDLKKNTAYISQAFVGDEMEDSTKTAKPRTVKLNSRALAAVKRQKNWTYAASERVFHDPGTNKPWAYEQNARKRYWTPTLKALGLRYRRPYNTRHTYATVGLMAGVNPSFMAKQLGHDIKIFFGVYADWIDGSASDAEMQKIEAKIENKPLFNHLRT